MIHLFKIMFQLTSLKDSGLTLDLSNFSTIIKAIPAYSWSETVEQLVVDMINSWLIITPNADLYSFIMDTAALTDGLYFSKTLLNDILPELSKLQVTNDATPTGSIDYTKGSVKVQDLENLVYLALPEEYDTSDLIITTMV